MQQDVECTSQGDVQTHKWALLLEMGPHCVVQAVLNALYSSDVHLNLLSWSHFIQLCLLCIYLFKSRISLCTPGWPGTHYM